MPVLISANDYITKRFMFSSLQAVTSATDYRVERNYAYIRFLACLEGKDGVGVKLLVVYASPLFAMH